eukprot:XP_011603437.1 PREDICTED: EF-hand domain-containing family member B isoform X1 [Takifugu rubripes]
MDGKPEDTHAREQADRKLRWAPTNTPSRSGKHTPHFHDGRNVARTLRWLGETERFSGRDPVWRRSGSRDRLAVQLGVKDTNQNKDTFPAEHSCGNPSPNKYGHAEPAEWDGSRDRRRRPFHSLQNRLKMANFSRFSSLLQAFTHYDRKGQGFIDKEDLQAVCHQFQLHVSGSVLDDLMDYCDTDGDGLINFVEFANFLSWKDMMPINSQEARALTRERPSSTASADREEPQPPPGQALVKPEDLEPVNPAGSLKSVRTLVKQQADPDQFRTMSSVIGLRGESHSCTYGVPTVRTDLPVPRVKRVGDSTNYGDAATASELLRPSVYDLYGVDEEQLLCPRSRKELSQIFVGLDLSEEMFEEVWKLASAEHEAGEHQVEPARMESQMSSIIFMLLKDST